MNNNIGNYFTTKKDNTISLKENTITGKKYRFTVLTERLIRLEYNKDGIFENRPSQRVIYRKFPKVNFQISQSELLLQIITPYFSLDYAKEKPFTGTKISPSSNLKITLNKTDRVWYYNHPEARNFGGINYSLDNFQGLLKLDKGLYSTDGFAILDDSDSLLIEENGQLVSRLDNSIDIYIFMYKKDFGMCLHDYYQLTGFPMLLPRSALGTWWYKNESYTNKTLANLLNNFKEEKILLSSIILGQNSLSTTEPLNLDETNLSINDLKELTNKYNTNFGLTTDPSLTIKKGTNSYQTIKNNLPTLASKQYSFLPLTNNNLTIYSNYFIKNHLANNFNSFVIDYNNPKDKKALAIISHYYYATSQLYQNKRISIFSRNHSLAPHRNTIIFTGKTKVDWNTLSILPRYNQSASNNGISYLANAIGGYYGGIENFELYIRYLQLGVFSPILLLASDNGKYYKREPWRWNETEKSIIKKYMNLRTQLIPYLYTECYNYHKNGNPIIQPLYYQYPKIYDEPLYKNQYFFGSQMLVCPITKKKNQVMNRVVQRMFIPEGIWYELESGKKYLGNKYYMSFYRDEDYPVFLKEGAIIPLSKDNTTDLPINMEIIIVPGRDGFYQLYEDDGITNNYKNSNFSLTDFNFKYQQNNYELTIKTTTNPGLIPQIRNYQLRFKNTKQPNIISILLDNTNIKANYYQERNDLIIEIEDINISRELKIICSDEQPIENSTIRLINDDILGILEDLEIETTLKEKIDAILFSDLSIKKKRIAIRKLKNTKLEPKFIKMFLNLLEYIKTV